MYALVSHRHPTCCVIPVLRTQPWIEGVFYQTPELTIEVPTYYDPIPSDLSCEHWIAHSINHPLTWLTSWYHCCTSVTQSCLPTQSGTLSQPEWNSDSLVRRSCSYITWYATCVIHSVACAGMNYLSLDSFHLTMTELGFSTNVNSHGRLYMARCKGNLEKLGIELQTSCLHVKCHYHKTTTREPLLDGN